MRVDFAKIILNKWLAEKEGDCARRDGLPRRPDIAY